MLRVLQHGTRFEGHSLLDERRNRKKRQRSLRKDIVQEARQSSLQGTLQLSESRGQRLLRESLPSLAQADTEAPRHEGDQERPRFPHELGVGHSR